MVVHHKLKNGVLSLSHGGNTGSNPVGDANNFKLLGRHSAKRLTNFSQRRGWTWTDKGGFGGVFQRPTVEFDRARNDARSTLMVLYCAEGRPLSALVWVRPSRCRRSHILDPPRACAVLGPWQANHAADRTILAYGKQTPQLYVPSAGSVTGGLPVVAETNETRRGRPARIALSEPMPAEIEILPTSDRLADCCTVAALQEGMGTPSPRSDCGRELAEIEI